MYEDYEYYFREKIFEYCENNPGEVVSNPFLMTFWPLPKKIDKLSEEDRNDLVDPYSNMPNKKDLSLLTDRIISDLIQIKVLEKFEHDEGSNIKSVYLDEIAKYKEDGYCQLYPFYKIRNYDGLTSLTEVNS